MATKSKATSKATQPQVHYTCTACGKKLTRNASQTAGVGHTCAALAAKFTPAQLQAHYASVTGNVPQGYIPLATLDKAVKAARAKGTPPGITISKMVKAIGGDRALNAPANPICAPVYNGRQRWVNGWLATPQGLQAIATGNYAHAPKL
jgi:hypothetical protein